MKYGFLSILATLKESFNEIRTRALKIKSLHYIPSSVCVWRRGVYMSIPSAHW